MKVYTEAYGCAANQGDASIVEGILEREGHELVDSIENADVLILFTCIVIEKTEQRMLHRMSIFRDAKKPLIVAGCMASAMPGMVKKILPEAYLLPPRSLHEISDIMDFALEGRRYKKSAQEVDKSVLPIKTGIKVNIPISDGCLYNCSYCITKRARGSLTSYSEGGIAEMAADAIRKGCREIRLTSQDTAAYGMDSGSSFLSLVERVCSIEGNFRIRVGMMHPLSLKKRMDEIIEIFSKRRVYKFLHLPLQSGSDEILKKMRRGYTFDDFREMVEEMRKKVKDITFATDVIVAFPTESEEQFEETCNAIRELEPDVINITRFSPRPYTDAKKMARIDTKIAKERSRKITEIASSITLKKNKECIGRSYEVMVVEKQGRWTVGKTENYKSVFLDKGIPGEFFTVDITDATETHLMGERRKNQI